MNVWFQLKSAKKAESHRAAQPSLQTIDDDIVLNLELQTVPVTDGGANSAAPAAAPATVAPASAPAPASCEAPAPNDAPPTTTSGAPSDAPVNSATVSATDVTCAAPDGQNEHSATPNSAVGENTSETPAKETQLPADDSAVRLSEDCVVRAEKDCIVKPVMDEPEGTSVVKIPSTILLSESPPEKLTNGESRVDPGVETNAVDVADTNELNEILAPRPSGGDSQSEMDIARPHSGQPIRNEHTVFRPIREDDSSFDDPDDGDDSQKRVGHQLPEEGAAAIKPVAVPPQSLPITAVSGATAAPPYTAPGPQMVPPAAQPAPQQIPQPAPQHVPHQAQPLPQPAPQAQSVPYTSTAMPPPVPKQSVHVERPLHGRSYSHGAQPITRPPPVPPPSGYIAPPSGGHAAPPAAPARSGDWRRTLSQGGPIPPRSGVPVGGTAATTTSAVLASGDGANHLHNAHGGPQRGTSVSSAVPPSAPPGLVPPPRSSRPGYGRSLSLQSPLKPEILHKTLPRPSLPHQTRVEERDEADGTDTANTDDVDDSNYSNGNDETGRSHFVQVFHSVN